MMPVFIPMIINGGGRLPPEAEPYALGVLLFAIYWLFYLMIMVATDKNKYTDLSIFGRIVFFPLGLIPWVIRKLF